MSNTKRIWDPKGKYEKYFLKEYDHWAIEVACRQHTFGCLLIFLKYDIEKLTELNSDAFSELHWIIKNIENALIGAFMPDRFNYL